jgi:hypothetical protein
VIIMDYTYIVSNWCPVCLNLSGGTELVGGEFHIPSPNQKNVMVWRCEKDHRLKVQFSAPHKKMDIHGL